VQPRWKAEEVVFEQITSALSNTVYRVRRGDDKLLLRLYGSAEHGLFTRSEEVRRSLFLASHGFGPQVLHTFDGGRIESWVDGDTPSNTFMRTSGAIAEVAKRLKSLHDKTGLNHNDLHRNNMLFKDGEVQFLDFEYSGPCDPAYDIANHFNEWMYPYTGSDPHLFQLRLYPSLAQRRHFASNYLGDTSGKGSIVDDFLKEVESRRQDSHTFWVNWAERTGPSEFNYLYASARRKLIEGADDPEPMVERRKTPGNKVLQNIACTVGTFDGLTTLLSARDASPQMS